MLLLIDEVESDKVDISSYSICEDEILNKLAFTNLIKAISSLISDTKKAFTQLKLKFQYFNTLIWNITSGLKLMH